MPGTVTVVNKKVFRGPVIYIGRPSILGNPYPVSMGRAKCIAKFKANMLTIMSMPADLRSAYDTAFAQNIEKLIEMVRNGKDINLACYCKPLACHGDVIKAYIESQVA